MANNLCFSLLGDCCMPDAMLGPVRGRRLVYKDITTRGRCHCWKPKLKDMKWPDQGPSSLSRSRRLPYSCAVSCIRTVCTPRAEAAANTLRWGAARADSPRGGLLWTSFQAERGHSSPHFSPCPDPHSQKRDQKQPVDYLVSSFLTDRFPNGGSQPSFLDHQRIILL